MSWSPSRRRGRDSAAGFGRASRIGARALDGFFFRATAFADRFFDGVFRGFGFGARFFLAAGDRRALGFRDRALRLAISGPLNLDSLPINYLHSNAYLNFQPLYIRDGEDV